MQIEVIDSLMGNGKTYSTLRYIESLVTNNSKERWIYCTVYLEEIDINIANSPVPDLWKTPKEYGQETKQQDLINLLQEPNTKLIAITHKLLEEASKNAEVNFLIRHLGYKLFLDETLDLIEPYDGVKKGDFLSWLSSDRIVLHPPYGRVEWIAGDDNTNGLPASFDQLRRDSRNNIVFGAINNGSIEEAVNLVSIASDTIFKQFSRVILATYMVENTLFNAYCEIKGIDLVKCADVICSRNTTKQSIRDRITFIKKHDRKFLGRSLSSGWWVGKTKHCATKDDIKAINNIIRNIGDNHGCKGNPHLLGFTVPQSVLGGGRDNKTIHPRGYPPTVSSVVIDDNGNESQKEDKARGAYVPCNARASNSYADKIVMVHAYGRHPFPAVVNYLAACRVNLSKEAFALTELVQWVWRSSIRKGNDIHLAILDEKMRGWFLTWLAKE